MRETEINEAAGYWWSADSPNIRVPGVVRLAEEGKYELTTIGTLGRSFGAPGSLADVTLLGICGGTKYTLLRAIMSNQRVHGTESGSKAETWKSFVMIRGTHLLPSTRFKSATFRCSGLPWLWGRWGAIPEDHPDERYEVGAVLRDVRGCEVNIVRSRFSEIGLGRSSYRDHIAIHVIAEEGLTLDELDSNFVVPLCAFTACVTGKESQVSHQNLWEFIDDRDDLPGSVVVDPWTSRETDERYGASLIKENDAFFEDVMLRWLEFSEKLLNPMVIAAPRKQRGYLEMETFAAVSAVEKVQRELTEGPPTSFADTLKNILAEHRVVLGLNSDERSKIVNAVRLSEFPLRRRLEHLVGGNAESFFIWFLGGHTSEWAEVSATVRNRLGHGLARPEGQSENYVLLMDVLDAARNVIFLRLLIECGFPKEELKTRMENSRDWNWQVECSDKWAEYRRFTAAQ